MNQKSSVRGTTQSVSGLLTADTILAEPFLLLAPSHSKSILRLPGVLGRSALPRPVAFDLQLQREA